MEDHSERILQSCFIWESKRKAQRMVSILHKKSVYKGRVSTLLKRPNSGIFS